ncbi:MAG: alpha/beta hydrolase [Rhodospirillaceae bacterium]
MPTIERAGATLHYTVDDLTPPWVAEPETVLFHHGIGATGGIWADSVPVLAGDYRLVRLDGRGNGGATVPGPDFDWTMDGLLDDLLAVADAVGADRFHLVGESLGGTVCYATALRDPERLRSITALCTGHRGGDIQLVGKWRDNMAAEGMQAWSDRMMDHRFLPGAIPDAKWRWFHEVQSASAPDAALGLAEMLIRQHITDELPKIETPTLILHPDRSPFLPVETPEAAHNLIAESKLHVFSPAKHGIALSHGREAAGIAADFLSRRTR